MLLRAALYCRLSKDDELQGESSSICTQKLMLEQYCYEHQLTIAGWYIDDGYSGLTFSRPGFQRMLDDIEAGLIDIVITKDLSRLGRDYIMTGYYTDIYFSRMKVRYIAVNDEIDTAHGFSDIAPFKNILNDMYARDISRKIKSAKRQRALQGYYISGQPPYGYRVDTEDHTHLMIDPEAAKIIRYIYRLAVTGKSADAICSILTEEKIPTPAQYKAEQGDKRFSRYADTASWNRTTVSKILHDPVYVGTMVNHKSEVVSYKTKEKRIIPVDQRIIVEHTHEAIIDQELADAVKSILKERSHPHRNDFDNWLDGKVYCSECDHRLTINSKKQKNGMYYLFRCSYHFDHPDKCLHHHAIAYSKLLEYVAQVLKDRSGKTEISRADIAR